MQEDKEYILITATLADTILLSSYFHQSYHWDRSDLDYMETPQVSELLALQDNSSLQHIHLLVPLSYIHHSRNQVGMLHSQIYQYLRTYWTKNQVGS